jgi:hypothetical protein
LSDQWATVTTPTGVQTIANPLFRYDFHPVSVSDMVYNPVRTTPRRFQYHLLTVNSLHLGMSPRDTLLHGTTLQVVKTTC